MGLAVIHTIRQQASDDSQSCWLGKAGRRQSSLAPPAPPKTPSDQARKQPGMAMLPVAGDVVAAGATGGAAAPAMAAEGADVAPTDVVYVAARRHWLGRRRHRYPWWEHTAWRGCCA